MRRISILLLLATVLSVFAATRATAAEPFFFIQLSDPQMGMFSEDKETAQDAANFEFVVTAINRLRPAFVVITGDLINKPADPGQLAEYRRIKAKIAPSIPVYDMPGNHDVRNLPTPESVAAYVKAVGPDHYVFRHGDFTGLVLDSTLIHTPQFVTRELAEQEQWLRAELANAKTTGARHVVIFQHHPWFLEKPAEPDQYFNIPLARRTTYLTLFHEAGVRYLFSGHYHRNAGARDGDLEAIVTGPVGKPLGGAKSGLRVAIVRDDKIEHRFYELGELPTQIDLAPAPAKPAVAAPKK